VLELSAGECARRGVVVGDMLELRDRANGDGDPSSAADEARDDVPLGDPLAEHWQGGELSRLKPLRVLVISPDRHFRTVMSLLLARRNCSVTTAANVTRVAELAAREAVGVVVVDIDESPGAVAAVEALARPTGVVVVADEVQPGLPEPSVLAKWGPFGELVAAIELADERREAGVRQP
jgi:hypothetical protein